MTQRTFELLQRLLPTDATKAISALSSVVLSVSLSGCGGGGSSLFNNDDVTTGGDGGGSGGSSSFAIVSCSLGGAPCGGASNVVQQSTQIVFTFNAPVLESSVTAETLNIVEVDTGGGGGGEPAGIRKVAGNKVTFIPEVSFDSSGNVIYGFSPNRTYRIRIPSGQGNTIRSVNGKNNTAAVDTNVIVTNQLADVKPGSPSAALLIPTPAQINAAPVNTPIEIEFDDIMDASTLVNKIQGTSNSMAVKVDLDGETDTPADFQDQIDIPGTWDISFNSTNQTTTVSFAHPSDFPGPGPTGSRRIVVVMNSALIKDLGGNTLAGGQVLKFKTTSAVGSPFTITENFGDNLGEDAQRSGANMWNSAANPGVLVPGVGGGSGTHGDFVASTANDFNNTNFGAIATDGIAVSTATVKRTPLTIATKESLAGSETTISNGIYQFASLQVGDGTEARTVRFEGANAARIFVRGAATIGANSTLSVRGLDGSPQSPTAQQNIDFAGFNTPCTSKAGGDPLNTWTAFPQYIVGKTGARGGALAGSGGDGGDLPINTPLVAGSPQLNALVAAFTSFNGSSGTVAQGPTTASNQPATAGGGTKANPINNVLTTPFEIFANVFQTPGVGFIFDNVDNDALCEGIVGQFQNGVSGPLGASLQMGSGGGGGASHFEDGTAGGWCTETTGTVTGNCNNGAGLIAPPNFATKLAPPNPPQVLSNPGIGAGVYPLVAVGTAGAKGQLVTNQPDFGADGIGNFALLRGGAGGGGGGTNIFGTAGNIALGGSATWNGSVQPTTVAPILSVGAAGGGGGGAMQLQAGRSITVNAVAGIDAGGGDGGDHHTHPTNTQTPLCLTISSNFFGHSMAPGGGGGGGSVVLQTPGDLSLVNGGVSVRGGLGGDGRPLNASAAAAPLSLGTTGVGGQAVRVRGGNGGGGRAFVQVGSGSGAVNPNGITPIANVITGTTFLGLNSDGQSSNPNSATDFSGAQTVFYKIDLSTSFNTLLRYRVTIKTTTGNVVLVQDDATNNDVLNGTTGTFALGGPLPFQIFFQGSRANAQGQEDPNSRTVWSQKLTDLSISSPKFVRAVILFSRPAQVANPSFLSIEKLEIDAFGG